VDDVPDFDADDWVDAEVALHMRQVPEVDVPHHGNGGDQTRTESLNGEQADAVIEHSIRLRSLKQAQDIFKEAGGAFGDSLSDTASRVIHSEIKRFNTKMGADKEVRQEVRAGLEAEEAHYRRARVEFQEHMERKREKARVQIGRAHV